MLHVREVFHDPQRPSHDDAHHKEREAQGREVPPLTLLALGATLALGLGFLGMEIGEFVKLAGEGGGPSRSAFLSAFFTLLGTHGLHVALGSVWMLALSAHVYLRGLNEGATRKLMCLGLFWHFLDIIWIFIFTFVYLFGSL